VQRRGRHFTGNVRWFGSNGGEFYGKVNDASMISSLAGR